MTSLSHLAFSRHYSLVIITHKATAAGLLLLFLWLTVLDLFIPIVLGQTGSLFSCDRLSVYICISKKSLSPISSSALAG